ncbi:hypothetical protein WJX77_004632 [Trebouxia sp. C0004]
MPLADVSGSELSGPSSELIRSPVKLNHLSGVPHSGILPCVVVREVVSPVLGLDSRDHILFLTRTYVAVVLDGALPQLVLLPQAVPLRASYRSSLQLLKTSRCMNPARKLVSHAGMQKVATTRPGVHIIQNWRRDGMLGGAAYSSGHEFKAQHVATSGDDPSQPEHQFVTATGQVASRAANSLLPIIRALH